MQMSPGIRHFDLYMLEAICLGHLSLTFTFYILHFTFYILHFLALQVYEKIREEFTIGHSGRH